MDFFFEFTLHCQPAEKDCSPKASLSFTNNSTPLFSDMPRNAASGSGETAIATAVTTAAAAVEHPAASVTGRRTHLVLAAVALTTTPLLPTSS